MKLRRVIALLCACLWLCNGKAAYAAVETVPLQNGGFESGNTDGWTALSGAAVDGVAAHDGAYGCLLTGDGGWDDLLYQTFAVVPGRTYVLQFQYKAVETGVSWYLLDGNADGTRIARGWAGNDDWTCVTKEFTAPGDTVCLLFRCSGSNQAERVYLDCIEVSGWLCDEHVYANTCDPACDVCGETREVAHLYDDAYDPDCNLCGEVRTIAPTPAQRLNDGGASISRDVSGVAFRFFLDAEKGQCYPDRSYVTESATVYPFVNNAGFRLVRMGAVLSNAEGAILDLEHLSEHTIDVQARYLCRLTDDRLTFAVRIINIPEIGWNTVISARPYYIYSDGNQDIVVYGDAVSQTYNGLAAGFETP